MKNVDLKNKKIALYTPYLDVLGGGEKHILSIIEVFHKLGGEIYIFWNKKLTQQLKERFNFSFLNKINWLPTYLKKPFYLKDFNYFFYVTDGSYFFSLAKKNFVFCMVPKKSLYNLNLINKIKLFNYWFISNSSYTSKWLKKWGLNPITIPPYISEELILDNTYLKKEKIILSVGRFFSHLHSKNHDLIINTYLNLKKNSNLFRDYQLILAGGLKKEDENYFQKLKLLTKNDPSIIFKPNLSFFELKKLYQLSTYFWHFTGLLVDEKNHPEKVEHFGLAPLEAMANQCITFCHNSGGPKLFIKNFDNGILFNNEKELIKKIIKVEKDNLLKSKIKINSYQYIKNNFNFKKFQNKILKIL